MKKFSLIFLIVSSFVFFVPQAEAQLAQPFGGLVTFTVPCACTGTLNVWFTPLYIAGTPITGQITYSPFTTILYAYFNIGVPGTWHLGSYIPGVQACWVPVGLGCAPVPSLGLMTQVGTSRLF